MKIGFDYKAIIGGGGNKTYSHSLISSLAIVDKENKYFLFGFWHDYFLRRGLANIKNKNFKFVPAYFSRLKFSIPHAAIKKLNQWSLRLVIAIKNIDILHITNPVNFVFGLKKEIVTIHDLSVLHNESWAKESSVEFYRQNMSRLLKEAKGIIAVSEFTKKDIIEYYNINEEKITVVPEAAAEDYFPAPDKNYLKEKFGINDYLLCTGQLQPRKNIIRLIEAYAGLGYDLIDRYELVLVGASQNDIFLTKIKETIKKLGLKDKVRLLGWVSVDDLRKIYSGTELFIYPSLFEGFGLPILEAMKCGAPVAVARSSSLPEVAGQAALYFDPTNVSEITAVMNFFLLNENLRLDYKNRSIKRANEFSWLKTARETLTVYEKIQKL